MSLQLFVTLFSVSSFLSTMAPVCDTGLKHIVLGVSCFRPINGTKLKRESRINLSTKIKGEQSLLRFLRNVNSTMAMHAFGASRHTHSNEQRFFQSSFLNDKKRNKKVPLFRCVAANTFVTTIINPQHDVISS